jgi:hypothetical protein
MRSRQRKTITLEVTDRQRTVIERNIAALPRELGVEPERTGSDLPALFYHPNAAARVLALVVSAGFDVARERSENAEKKVNRAIEVLTLVTDDETGRGHLQGLAERIGSDTTEFLPLVHDTLVPYLQGKMGASDAPVKKSTPKPTAMPRALEDGESLPTERRSGRKPEPAIAKPKIKTAPEPVDVPEEKVEVEAPVLDEAPSKPVEAASEKATEAGPSASEAAAAAAAALAAIEAPYEDMVRDDSAPRFDPDRDLKPDDGRRRRRRSKAPEGFERMKPDQRPDLEMMNQDGSDDTKATETTASSEIEELCRVSRHGNASDVVGLALDVLKQLLRRAGDLEADGRVKLEMTLTTADGDIPQHRRRRRRRRRGGRNEG